MTLFSFSVRFQDCSREYTITSPDGFYGYVLWTNLWMLKSGKLSKILRMEIVEDRDTFLRAMESFLLLAKDEDLEVENIIL